MPAFAKPIKFKYNVSTEIQALRDWRDTEPGREIPSKSASHLVMATWNIANLGDAGQQRSLKDAQLIAEMIGWFDLVAIQEVKEQISDLRRILSFLPKGYETVFTDVAGNNERMVYVYDSLRVERLELAGEVAVPPADHRHIKIDGIGQKFKGFDRNPYAVAFRCGSFRFTLVNAHMFYGSKSKRNINRRALENYAVARWADLFRKGANAYTSHVVVMGDLNMPKAQPGDPIFDALTKRGLHIPDHSSKIASAISSDNEYDQIAFFPGLSQKDFIKSGIFDFDGALFSKLWKSHTPKEFKAFVRYHISDHRILWAQFKC